MNCKYTNITKDEFISKIQPLLPENKRGFKSKKDQFSLFTLMVRKLKTGCQWRELITNTEGVEPISSWQLVFYYFRKWSKAKVFSKIFKEILKENLSKLDTSKLNLDGTQSLAKKGGEKVAYQGRKKGKTSNILIMTDGNGLPIGIGDIISGNHNDLHDIVPQFSKMTKNLKECNINVEESVLNADKGFDSKSFRRACQRRNIIPNIKENVRNRKKNKRGAKRKFDEKAYAKRFVNERCFAWMDSFRTLLTRFDVLAESWLNWHFLVCILILLKV